MYEPTAPATSSPEWDASADGTAYSGYDGEAVSSTAPDERGLATTEAESEGEEISPDGVRIDEDGEVSFGDEFFGDLSKSPREASSSPEAPNWYTNDELRETPYEQWELERLHGDVKEFAPIVREQLEARQAAAHQRQMQEAIQNTPMPQFMTEPKPYTPQELATAAKARAIEMLGLEDADDFDDYEAEHRAAMQLSMNELMQTRNAELASYQRGITGWRELQDFNARLARQPDFNDFNQWYSEKLREHNVTHEQMSNRLYEDAVSSGNNFRGVAQVIAGWYREYQAERGMQARAAKSPSTMRRERAKRPAVLEGTTGSGYDEKRRIDYRKFGELDDDAQTQALIDLGIV